MAARWRGRGGFRGLERFDHAIEELDDQPRASGLTLTWGWAHSEIAAPTTSKEETSERPQPQSQEKQGLDISQNSTMAMSVDAKLLK